MKSRRRAREIALQVLFQKEFNPKVGLEEALNLYLENFEASDEIKDYAKGILDGIWINQVEIDKEINQFSTKWPLNRMPMVDRNILRVATYEMKYLSGDVPQIVVINEAIEVAKRYGSGESAAFVNSVLDKLLHSGDQ